MNIIDASKLPINTVLQSTVVIVGTGPAGTTVARELASTGVDILIIEGGELSESKFYDDTLKADSVSQRDEPLEKARTKRLGGASTQWGGRTYPFDALDFQARDLDHISIAGWPISREDLNPYYKRAVYHCGVNNMEYTAEKAIKSAPKHLIGINSTVNSQGVWRWGPPVDFGKELLKDLAKYKNIRLLYKANLTKIVKNPVSGNIVELKVQAEPDHNISIRGSEFVLAMGGLETARILLHSEVGNEFDQVGKYYAIHPVAEVGKLHLSNPSNENHSVSFVKSRDGVWVRRNLQIHEHIRKEQGLLNMGFAIWYDEPRNPEHGDPLLSMFALTRKTLTKIGGFRGTGMHRRYAEINGIGQHIKNVLTGFPDVGFFAIRWLKDRHLDRRRIPSFTRVSRNGVYRIRFDAEQSVDINNRVTLSNSEFDAFGVPRLSIRNIVSIEDRDNYLRSLELLAKGLEESGFAKYTPPTREEIQSLELVDATHQMGLVKMGTDKETSVVDSNLKVWSCDNLYLATTGVFSTAGMAGPTLTVVALSVRLADHLAIKLGV